MTPKPQTPESAEGEMLQAGYRFALALAHDSVEAEELIQETWLALVVSRGFVETKAVLFASIHQRFIERCQRKGVIAFVTSTPREAGHTIKAPEACLKDDLSGILAGLKPAEREVIFLRYCQGNTTDEISGIMGKTRGTVTSLARRALAKLRGIAATI